MSKLGLVVVLFLMTGRTSAHQFPAREYSQPGPDSATHFVLIQADPGRTFYIRINDQVYGSSDGGHLILAQLKDSTYTVVVGFPGQVYPEQRYLLVVRNRDFALSLRRMDDRWTLYDRKGQALSFAPDPLADRQPLPAGVKKDDAFSRMMSAIVQDTSVMYNTYVVSGEDTAHDKVTSSPLGIVPSAPTGVMKLSERKSPQALRLVFADRADARSTDTIDVVIPVDSAGVPGGQIRPDSTRQAGKIRPDSTRPAGTRVPAAGDSSAQSAKPSLVIVNSDCHAFASDYDVDKLRVKMLDAANDADRVIAAHKVFKTKCFTTKQLRALSEVFPTEAGKFDFLQSAYPFVSDGQFVDLVDLFTDPVYAGKFRTMTGRH